MGHNSNRLGIRMIGALALGGLALGSTAVATPGSGFSNSPYPVGHFRELDVKADKDGKWDLFLKTKDNTDIGVDKLTVQGGGHSGWHKHAGPVFITVVSGTLVRYNGGDASCPVTTYHAGDTFVEAPNVVHLVRNGSESATAEFVGIQIRPEGAAGRIDAPMPENCM